MTKQLILAIDFDGVIVEEIYPAIGSLLPHAKETINQLHSDGHYIIIWTCRKNEEVVEFLNKNEIPFSIINASHPDAIKQYGYEARKVGADIFVDDRGILGIPSWLEIYRIITEKAIEYDKREVR